MRGPFLPPWVLQISGLLVIAVMVTVKITTHEESVPLLGVGLGLATLGGLGAVSDWMKTVYFKGEDDEELPNGSDRRGRKR